MNETIKDVIAVIFCSLVIAAIVVGVVIRYPDERCGQLQAMFDQKAQNPDLYPGFTMTQELIKICPGIHQ